METKWATPKKVVSYISLPPFSVIGPIFLSGSLLTNEIRSRSRALSLVATDPGTEAATSEPMNRDGKKFCPIKFHSALQSFALIQCIPPFDYY